MAGNIKRHGKTWPLYGKPDNRRSRDKVSYAPKFRDKGPARRPNLGGDVPIGVFEAISYKPNGAKYATRHHSRAAAERRLTGNRRHDRHTVVDHTPPTVEA
jgi:hypothetical protein